MDWYPLVARNKRAATPEPDAAQNHPVRDQESGASGGDDALAMGINKLTGMKLATVYLISDLTVLALSLTYIPLGKIVYSLLTVVLSGQIIGIIGNNKASA